MGLKYVSRKLYIIIGTMLLVALMMSISVYADEVIDKSEFASEELYNALLDICDRGENGNRNGVIDKSEAEQLGKIELNFERGFKFTEDISLKGIENFPNITEFWWKFQKEDVKQIVDLERIAELEKIDVLALFHQERDDWSFLHNFDNLYFLSLEGSNVDDISFLKNNPRLDGLDLRYCTNIEDFSYIKYCDNMGSLILAETNLEDASFLYEAKFDRIWHLSLSKTPVSDVFFLPDMLDTLENIDFNDMYLEELPDMSGAEKLSILSLGGNYLNADEVYNLLPPLVISNPNWLNETGLNQQREGTFDNSEGTSTDNNEQPTSTEENTEENTETNTDESIENNVSTMTDGYVKVEGIFESGAYLEAVKIVGYLDYIDYEKDLYKYQIITGEENVMYYDISVYKDVMISGNVVKLKVQPKGGAKVTIALTDEEIHGHVMEVFVFRWEADGTMTLIECDYDDGVVTFQSDHFSIFSIVMTKIISDDNGNDNGSKNEEWKMANSLKKWIPLAIIVVVLFVVLVGIIVYEIIRRELYKKIEIRFRE